MNDHPVAASPVEATASTLTRRTLLAAAGTTALAAATGVRAARAAAVDVVRIGYLSPRNGPLSLSLAGDDHVLGLVRTAFASGLTIGGKTYAVDVIDRDTQSDPEVAVAATRSLIAEEGVDLVLATFTPETVNPIAAVCEATGTPGLFNVCPWEAFYFGRGAKPGEPSPFKSTFLFSFGTEQFHTSYVSAWGKLETNRKVAVLYPDDVDGNALRGSLLPLLRKDGYTLVDAGSYATGETDFTRFFEVFLKERCEIFACVPMPPDFPVIWREAALSGFTKTVKICQVAKAGNSPTEVAGMGSLGRNICVSNYWHRSWPYASPLAGVTAEALAAGYETATGNQWLQQLGASLSLFDAAAEGLKASGAPKDKAAVIKALATLKTTTVAGPVDFTAGPVPNVATAPVFVSQFVKPAHGPFKLEMVQVENAGDPGVPIGAPLVPYS